MLFLARVASGPEVTKEITGGEAGVHRAGWPTKEQRSIIRVRDFIAAAIVERAASAGRVVSSDACFQFCRYSADTLHPSPKLLDKNDL
jgi:hypothetical protein